jgi:dTDP-4-dehydrorhamnose reductase
VAHSHIATSDAISRYDLGVLIAQRDGLNASRLRVGRRTDTRSPGALDVRTDSHTTSVG